MYEDIFELIRQTSGYPFPQQLFWELSGQKHSQPVFEEECKKAGIEKHLSTHSLRHSFASHLLESGCDIKYIQALIGHVDSKSMEVYLHVSDKTLLGIRSPFDTPEVGRG